MQQIQSRSVCCASIVRYFIYLSCLIWQPGTLFGDEFDEARKIAAAVNRQKLAIAEFLNTEQPNLITTSKKLIDPDAPVVNETSRCYLRKGYGLLVSQQKKQVNLVLQNPTYTARLSKTSKEKLPDFELEKLPNLNFCLDDFAKPDQAWFANVVSMKMMGLYFKFGGRDFEAALNECIEAGGVAQIADSSKDGLSKEISFKKWPGSTTEIKYRYDPSDHVILSVEGGYEGGVYGSYQIHTFSDLNGVRVPNCVSISTRTSSAKEIKQEFRWEYSPATFNDEMCFTSFFGLEEPNLNGFPPAQAPSRTLYLAGGILLSATVVLYLGKRIHARS